MATYKELLAQQKALEAQLNAARDAEKSSAIAQVRELVTEFGLLEVDVFGRSISRGGVAKSTVVPAKYKDPETAKTWTGRGKPPSWIAGKDREAFLIQ